MSVHHLAQSTTHELRPTGSTKTFFLVTAPETTISLNFSEPNSALDCFVVLLPDFDAPTAQTCRIDAQLDADFTTLHLQVLNFAAPQISTPTQLHPSITIPPTRQKVSAHLAEEILLLGGRPQLTTIPELSVASPDVQASHGASIHGPDPDKLFYLTAKNLSPAAATRLLVAGRVQAMLDQVQPTPHETAQILQQLEPLRK